MFRYGWKWLIQVAPPNPSRFNAVHTWKCFLVLFIYLFCICVKQKWWRMVTLCIWKSTHFKVKLVSPLCYLSLCSLHLNMIVMYEPTVSRFSLYFYMRLFTGSWVHPGEYASSGKYLTLKSAYEYVRYLLNLDLVFQSIFEYVRVIAGMSIVFPLEPVNVKKCLQFYCGRD